MDKRITSVRFALSGPACHAMARVQGERHETRLFSYFTYELSFTERELLGLTVEQARILFRARDMLHAGFVRPLCE